MDKTSNGVVIAYAEALIDTVYNFLHDENLARDIKTVDVSRVFDARRAEAIDVVKEAFTQGGESDGWRITGLW